MMPNIILYLKLFLRHVMNVYNYLSLNIKYELIVRPSLLLSLHCIITNWFRNIIIWPEIFAWIAMTQDPRFMRLVLYCTIESKALASSDFSMFLFLMFHVLIYFVMVYAFISWGFIYLLLYFLNFIKGKHNHNIKTANSH